MSVPLVGRLLPGRVRRRHLHLPDHRGSALLRFDGVDQAQQADRRDDLGPRRLLPERVRRRGLHLPDLGGPTFYGSTGSICSTHRSWGSPDSRRTPRTCHRVRARTIPNASDSSSPPRPSVRSKAARGNSAVASSSQLPDSAHRFGCFRTPPQRGVCNHRWLQRVGV